MPTQRKVEFIISAKDEFSATFGAAEKDIRQLREQLALPVVGPLTRSQQTLENAAIRRIRGMEQQGANSRLASLVEDKLFGGSNGNGQATIAGVDKLAPAAEKAKLSSEGLLQTIGKLGSEKGIEKLAEKFAGIAPKIGFALAAVKGAAMVFEAMNFAGDVARHHAQKNLEREAEDERKKNELAGTMSLGFGPAVKKFFNIGGYKDDLIAIEELEDATKAQDQHTAAMEKRAAVGKQLRETSEANAAALKLEAAAYQTAAEHAAYLNTQEQLRLALKKKAELPAGVAVPDEFKEELALRSTAALRALKDSFLADLKRSKELVDTLGGRLKDLLKADLENFKDASQMLGEARETGLRSEGRGLEADIAQLRRERDEALAETDDFGKRQAIRAKFAASESDRAKREHREELDARRKFGRESMDAEADLAGRRLELADRGADAQRLRAQKEYADRLDDVEQNLQQELRLHKEREPELRKRAAADAEAARESYGMTLEEIADRKRREFLPNAPAGIEGEAGILTGAIGAGMNGRSDELLSTNERTAKATEAQLKAAQTLNDKIDQLIAALRGGALGVVPSTP